MESSAPVTWKRISVGKADDVCDASCDMVEFPGS
jgi:hypothetical protein